jgi:hypothetical protein
MLELEPYKIQITEFITDSINRFIAENGPPSSIGIYCCPWAGWLTINFNKSKTLTQTKNNCPDFEFVEFDLLDFPEWQEEYELESPTYKIDAQVIVHQHDLGDAKLNELFFHFLEPLAAKIKQQRKEDILLQMLDSNFVKVIT